jgi:hypothetical protein
MGGILRKHLIVNHEMSTLIPMTLREAVAHEVMHYLLRTHLGKGLPMWLEEGLTTTMQRRFDNGAIAPETRQRRLQAWKRRGDLLSASEIATASLSMVQDLTDSDVDGWVQFSQVYALGATTVEFLASRHSGALQDFLGGIRNTPAWQEWFQSCFGKSFGEVFDVAIASATADSVSGHAEPPRWVCEEVERQLLPDVRDKSAPPSVRRRAIRSMSSISYVTWTDDLIAVLEEDNPVLQAHAQLGLDYLSGATGCATPEEWRGWVAKVHGR